MLQITVEGRELFDERTSEFAEVKTQTLQLEHSLVSVSKWEAKWHKPFLSDKQKTLEEVIDYFRCMTINKNVDPMIYYCLSSKDQARINAYIEDPATATWFSKKEEKNKNKEIITSELIYYSMTAFGIPFECEKWHLNRLLTLIHICSIKNQQPKKMSKNEIMNQNRALNAARRARSGSRG